MTAVEVLADKVREARRFRYIPDAEGLAGLDALLLDEWDTAIEFELRGGGDCDGYACWTVQRSDEAANLPDVEWRVICGHVLRRGEWLGHMWVAVVENGIETWADPTWGRGPGSPASLLYPANRRPTRRWTHRGGGHFDDQQDYPEVV